jgi:type III secretion protein W
MSLLADAAEELTFSVDSTEDFKLSEREEEDKSLKAQEERVRLYQDLMHQAGKSEALDQLVDQLRSSRTKSEVMRQVRGRFPDSSDAYAALEYTLKELEKTGASPESAQTMKDARDELLAEEGQAVRAGIQAMLVAQGYADLDDGDALRGLYRSAVCDFSSVNELFAYILDKYGQDKFEQAMSFLTRTLGSDLSADTQSMDTIHLESVNANLGLVRLVQSAHAQCGKVMDRWRNVHGIENCPLDSRALLGRILALREENFLGAIHFERIAAEARPPDIGREVLFLQELMQMTRVFPSQLFDGHSGHMKMLDAVQDAVDTAIAREDALYAAREGEAHDVGS